MASTLAIAAAATYGGLASIASASKTTPAGSGGGLVSGNVSLRVLAPTPNEVVTGPSLALNVIARGYKLDAFYAGTPDLPYIGHYHEILDGKLVDMTPLQDPTHDTISMAGVTRGKHVLTLVPARNDHSMVMSKAVMIPFYYEGPFRPQPAGYTGAGKPSIAITSPAAGATVRGSSFTMTTGVTNFVLSGESFGKALIAGEGHWHVFVDEVSMPHMVTMASTGTQTVPLKGVKPGRHTFYALLVDNHHMAIMPMTVAMVNLVVN
jgi:hypothetical protein